MGFAAGYASLQASRTWRIECHPVFWLPTGSLRCGYGSGTVSGTAVRVLRFGWSGSSAVVRALPCSWGSAVRVLWFGRCESDRAVELRCLHLGSGAVVWPLQFGHYYSGTAVRALWFGSGTVWLGCCGSCAAVRALQCGLGIAVHALQFGCCSAVWASRFMRCGSGSGSGSGEGSG